MRRVECAERVVALQHALAQFGGALGRGGESIARLWDGLAQGGPHGIGQGLALGPAAQIVELFQCGEVGTQLFRQSPVAQGVYFGLELAGLIHHAPHF